MSKLNKFNLISIFLSSIIVSVFDNKREYEAILIMPFFSILVLLLTFLMYGEECMKKIHGSQQ